MESSSPVPSNDGPIADETAAALRRVLHRWFVQYNPTYLLSAVLVFAGCFLWSRGAVREESLGSTLGIPLVAEVYAASLIGGAALLTRIGQRRPAVLLALIAIVYQWDTTLHTEACAYLGAIGVAASGAWFALFVGKLAALGWALRVRFTRPLVGGAVLAAASLTLIPWLVRQVGANGGGALLAVVVFALGSRDVVARSESVGPLDARGQTVLRRVSRAAWIMSGALVSLHGAMWWMSSDLPLSAALLALPLLAVRRVRSEALTWGLVLVTLALAAIVRPEAFFVTALLAAVALALRGLAPRLPLVAVARPTEERPVSEPYRAPEAGELHARAFVHVARPLAAGERARALAGSLFAAYLGAWTFRWSGGDWPAHVVVLDVALTLVVALAMWKTRARGSLLVPLLASYAHAALRAHLVPIPRSGAAWGETIVGLGFALLAASLVASYRLRAPVPRDGPT